MYLSLKLSGIRIIDGLYGFPGRNLGVLSYTAFLIIFLATVYVANREFIEKILLAIQMMGFLTIIYCVIQILGLDPINWDQNDYKVVAFFGNPNFLTAYLGIFVIISIPSIFENSPKKYKRYVALISVVASILIIIFSDSQQGLLIIFCGVFPIFYFWVRVSKALSKYRNYLLTIFLILGTLGILDLFQKLPWGSIFYQASISYRGDYWRAAWKTALDNPFFGVGFDGFINHYRLYRDDVAISRSNSEVRVDSAHNIFLDLLINGGFPLLIIYLGIIIYTTYCALKTFKKNEKFDLKFAALFGGWVGYLVQLVISINMISISVIGWLLSGAIIGFSATHLDRDINKFVKPRLKNIFALASGIFLSAWLITPLLQIDAEFRKALLTGDVVSMQSLAGKWPIISERVYVIASTLRVNGYIEEALEITRQGILTDPRSVDLWSEIYINPLSSKTEKNRALRFLKIKDPRNPRWLK
jgi:O-antigen ligase